jgi:hypothetical protein
MYSHDANISYTSCYPLLQRIVKLDPDIKQVSADALKTIALATVRFPLNVFIALSAQISFVCPTSSPEVKV